jgi:exosortase
MLSLRASPDNGRLERGGRGRICGCLAVDDANLVVVVASLGPRHSGAFEIMSSPTTRSDQASGLSAMNAGGAASARRFEYSTTPKVREPVRGGGSVSPLAWLIIALMVLEFLVLYRINFLQLVSVWYSNPNFSQGFAIPFISAFFVYQQWPVLRSLEPQRSAVGLALLIFGTATQVLFLVTGQIQFSELSMLVVLFGMFLWMLGWDYMRLLWLPICYLLFMIPPPQALYVKLTTPLQFLAASLGGHLLTMFGIPSIVTATQIHVQVRAHWDSLDVAQACSGIRSLTAFFALAIVLAYSVPRPVWQKLFLALCALPIAILCNALRVALTGVLFVSAGQEWARGSTHASLGMLMLIPAMFLQLGAAWALDHIFIEDTSVVSTAGGDT